MTTDCGKESVNRRNNAWTVSFMCGVLLAAAAAFGDEAREEDPSFFIAAYGWLPSMSANVVTDGMDQEIEVPFGDLIENTSGAFQLYAEGRWRRWFLAFDGTWLTLEGSEAGTLVDVNVMVEQRLYDFRVGRELSRQTLEEDSSGWKREMVWDVFGGARYFRTKPTIVLTPVLGDPTAVTTVDERWDPFVGTRVGYDFTRRLTVGARGDIGGFGIGSAAQFAWSVEGTVGFRVKQWFAVFGGYRWLSFDTVTGDGIARNGVDFRQRGPIIGGGIVF